MFLKLGGNEFQHVFVWIGIYHPKWTIIFEMVVDLQAIPVVPPGATTLFWQTNMINDTPSASKEVRASRTQEIVGAFSKTRFLHVVLSIFWKNLVLDKKKTGFIPAKPVFKQPYLTRTKRIYIYIYIYILNICVFAETRFLRSKPLGCFHWGLLELAGSWSSKGTFT